MNKSLKILHFDGLALFDGSIPGHILLGEIAVPETGMEAFAALIRSKYLSVAALTLPGLGLMVATGIPLMIRRKMTPNRLRWMTIKLVLVSLISINGVFLLLPTAWEMSNVAANAMGSGSLDESFWNLKSRESIFGAINLILILIVIGVTVSKPVFKRRHP